MSVTTALYPANPINVPPAATSASAGFKSAVKKVLISIILFFIVYMILIAIAALLAIGCLYAGFYVMVFSGHLLGIIAGVGIMSIGIMVFVFLIKFIFSVKKYDESGTVPITETEQPELFSFIRQLTTDTQTKFPKKIVLSPDVNASVFYNDSFWSMIFPVKKNLNIGLGLVNSLTLSEFKAVMAHEFGHFSQRSMKLGSFVYNVNKAVYNMLYENKDYGNFLSQFGSLHWAINIFVWVTIYIVQGIQIVLRGMYSFINKNYMRLSREMEFHADAVAASVSGSNNLVTALQKIEISNVCYQTVLQKADELLVDKTRLQNIYKSHNAVMEAYAVHNDLPLQNSTPLADENFFKKFQYHKVNIKDQWASHPPREERKEHLEQLNVEAGNDTRPAWVLFNQPEALQSTLSDTIYRLVPADTIQQQMPAAAFREKYKTEIEAFKLPAEYNGYYDTKQMGDINLAAVEERSAYILVDKKNFNALFSDEWISIIKRLAGNSQDVAVLQAINDKRIAIKTFDYDGDKMKGDEAPALTKRLETLITSQQEQLKQHDIDIAAFFYKAASDRGADTPTRLLVKYKTCLDLKKEIDQFVIAGQEIVNVLAPLLSGQKLSVVNAEEMAQDLRKQTNVLRPIIKSWIQQGVYDNNATLKTSVENLIYGSYMYFAGESFREGELRSIHQLVTETSPLIVVVQSKYFKDLLMFQLAICRDIL